MDEKIIRDILSVRPADTKARPSYEYLENLVIKQATEIICLKYRIEKAVEYINDNWDSSSYWSETLKDKVAELNISELEEILKGGK